MRLYNAEFAGLLGRTSKCVPPYRSMARSNVIMQWTRSKRVDSPPTPTPIRSLLPHPIPHKLFKLTLVVIVPSRQGRSILRHIPNRPSYSQVVQIGRNVVVGANDVKVAVGEAIEHVGHGLFGGPSCVWFRLGTASFSRMNPSGAGYQHKGSRRQQQDRVRAIFETTYTKR